MAFETTQWSMVLTAQNAESVVARKALEELCEAYWFPIYSYIRGRGYSREEAQDLTQSYFERFLDKSYLRVVDRDKGRFRSFLLATLKNFLSDEWDKLKAQKRGGTNSHLSLDFVQAENLFVQLPTTNENPERVYDKYWAQTLLARSLARLEAEQNTPEQQQRFKIMKQVISFVDEPENYAQIGARLGMEENAVKQAAHRLRKRFRDIVAEEAGQTIDNPAEVGTEISYLISLFER